MTMKCLNIREMFFHSSRFIGLEQMNQKALNLIYMVGYAMLAKICNVTSGLQTGVGFGIIVLQIKGYLLKLESGNLGLQLSRIVM